MTYKKWFNFVRWIGIAAIVCTLAAIIFMLAEAASPAEKSGATSDAFTNGQGNNVVINIADKDVPTKRLEVSTVQAFRGQTKQASVSFFPEESTDRELIYEISPLNSEDPNENAISVDKDGVLHFDHFGNSKLTVSLKSDPSIKASATITCFGTEPSKIESLRFTRTTFILGQMTAIYMLDQDGYNVSVVPYTKNFSDNGEHIQFHSGKIIPKKVGNVTVTLSHKNLNKNINATFDLKVNDNSSFVPLQSFASNIDVDEEGYYNIAINSHFDAAGLISPQPENASCAGYFSYEVENIDGNAVRHLGGDSFLAAKEGEAEITCIPLIAPEKAFTLKLKVFMPKPTEIHIEAQNVVVVDILYKIKVYGDDGYINKKDISYEIVRGKVDFESGGFRSKRLGKVTIKATYLPDPSITAQIELDTKLYKTFGQFIRKILGHLILFALIGFGLSYVFMLGLRRRRASIPISAVTGFVLAIISEGIQSVTPGRYASWTDVSIDVFGICMGILIAWALLALTLLIARIFKSGNKLASSIRSLTFANMFKPYVPVLLEYSASECVEPSATSEDASPQASASLTASHITIDDAPPNGDKTP